MPLDNATNDRAVSTTCPYCGVGCGVRATLAQNDHVKIEGDADHPANFGRLCSKGSALGETVSLDGRVLEPEINGKCATWNQALDLVAAEFSDSIERHGPDSVAFYVSGQLLTEDYYVANKLMKGFIGSANIDTNSRLCMSSSVSGHVRAFGSDTVPGTYEDLECADVVILTGSNLAWCHPVLFQRLLAAKKKRGTKIVVIDPRATATSEASDLHLAIAPGTDVALFSGLLRSLADRQALNRSYIDRYTAHFDDALNAASVMSVDAVARHTKLARKKIEQFYDLFASNERVVTVYSQGVNQSISGTDKVNAIINCHLATGRIGQPGSGPFSITGQPNAMGGREVGGLANMLTCHMQIANQAHRKIVQEFWNAPNLARKPGLKAVELFEAIDSGRIKALWIMGTNPADSMPDAGFVRGALQKCPFVVVSDVIRKTDTTLFADVLLPSLAWGEKNGTVTNSERRISRQRSFIPSPGEARPDWWQMTEVAHRMGFGSGFHYDGEHEIFGEYAALSGNNNGGTRDFDISAYANISKVCFDALKPFQWPQTAGAPAKSQRLFSDGRFFTPGRRARFVPTLQNDCAHSVSEEYPFVLNTGRVRDQWHTMTRTGKSPRLASHISEPFLEIRPDDARALGLTDASLAEVSSARGSICVRTLTTTRQVRGRVFVPMHWNDQFASNACVDRLIARAADPISGQPEFKATPVNIAPFKAAWYGFSVTACKVPKIDCDYWATASARNGWRAEIAGRSMPDNWEDCAFDLLGVANNEWNVISYSDDKAGTYRFAAFDGEKLMGALFIETQPVRVARNFIISALDRSDFDASAKSRLLAGIPPRDQPDCGSTVCACFDVGVNTIVNAVVTGRCMSVAEIGEALQAGTNCGSCQPELKRIIHEHALANAS